MVEEAGPGSTLGWAAEGILRVAAVTKGHAVPFPSAWQTARPHRPAESGRAWLRSLSAAAVAVVAGATLLTGCSSGSAAPHGHSGTGGSLVPAAASSGSSVTTLPPSHDNDAGRARIADTSPDADSDAVQRTPEGGLAAVPGG